MKQLVLALLVLAAGCAAFAQQSEPIKFRGAYIGQTRPASRSTFCTPLELLGTRGRSHTDSGRSLLASVERMQKSSHSCPLLLNSSSLPNDFDNLCV